MKNRIFQALICITICFVSVVGWSAAPKCTYKYDNDSSLLEWTAFKTNARKPVKGHFKDVKVTTKPSATTIQELIKNTSFTIDMFTVLTGDVARDKNLLENFFKKAVADGRISGTVTKVTGNENGTIDVKFTFSGGKVVMVPFTYTIDAKNRLVAKADSDILSFGWKDAHKNIHEACKDLHKGEDGESKTWTDLTLNVTTVFKADCKGKPATKKN